MKNNFDNFETNQPFRLIEQGQVRTHLLVLELRSHLEQRGDAFAHVAGKISGPVELAVRKPPDSVEKVVRLSLAEKRIHFVRVPGGRWRRWRGFGSPQEPLNLLDVFQLLRLQVVQAEEVEGFEVLRKSSDDNLQTSKTFSSDDVPHRVGVFAR